MVIFAAVYVMVCYRLGRRREICMCAVVRFTVFYRVEVMEGNGDVWGS